MKWFVYWNCGTCNQGDHDSGLKKFDMKDEALAFIETLYISEFDDVLLLRGKELPR